MNEQSAASQRAPTLAWHCLIAGACTLAWLFVLVTLFSLIFLVVPRSLRESKLMFLVPTVLLVGLTFGVTLLASIVSSRRAIKLAAGAVSRLEG